MAVDLHGREPSLPSELLTGNGDQNWSSSESAFNGFGSCGSSDLSTPVGSELDSTETESDEDGFMAELTRQMADYMLEEDQEEKDGEISSSHGHKLVGPSINPTEFHSHHNTHVNHQWRNQQHVRHSAGSLSEGRRGEKTELTQRVRPNQQFHPIGLSQPAGSGMRAVFLGGGGSRSTCSGTGVFLPRVNPVASEPCKKTRCSTVLIPARVLQALELHFNNKNKNDVIVGGEVYMQQKRQLDTQTRPTINYDKETQLPQEWTY